LTILVINTIFIISKNYYEKGGKKMDIKIPYEEVCVSSVDIMDLLDDLQDLADQGTALGRQIKKITSTLCKFGLARKRTEIPFPKADFNVPAGILSSQKKEACRPEIPRSKIIPFPGLITRGTNPDKLPVHQLPGLTPILALPGIPLPANIPDYRLMLQRDGLILLAWDKRLTEKGDRYTAYWVTSVGIPRFYASKPLCITEFFHAHPDHKSYAAEDGIEFYGQEAPVCLVHVAPELMMNNPRHGELRSAHINKLKLQGYKVNFNYKYLLKTEKKRALPQKKRSNGPKAS
jgi:hypothetical protein